MFWNVAGMRIKATDFWRKLADWEVMMLTETWIDKKRWEKIKNRLPGGYEWGMQEARKKKGKDNKEDDYGDKKGCNRERDENRD